MTPPAAKRPESVLVVVHAPGPRVLLLERVRPEGFWQSVTGSLEPGETPAEAAAREVAEETGLDAGGNLRDLGLTQRFPIAPAWRHRYPAGVTDNVEHAYALGLDRIEGPVLDPASHRRFAWLAPADAQARASSWTDRAAIRRALEI